MTKISKATAPTLDSHNAIQTETGFFQFTQHSKKLSLLSVSLAATVALTATPSHAQSLINALPEAPMVDTPRNVMPIPTTPQEIWTRILVLLQKNSGYTNKQDVEDVLGVRFPEAEDGDNSHDPAVQHVHFFKDEIPSLGRFFVRLSDDPKKATLTVGWGPELYEHPNCINLSKASIDLNLLNWSTGRRSLVSGRGGVEFFRAEEARIAKETGKTFNALEGFSFLFLLSPNQISQCVNGLSTSVYLTPHR